MNRLFLECLIDFLDLIKRKESEIMLIFIEEFIKLLKILMLS